MSCILHIETSTAVCSVAVSEDGQTIFVQEDMKGPSHAVSLGVFVDEALSFIDSHAIPLDAVAVRFHLIAAIRIMFMMRMRSFM